MPIQFRQIDDLSSPERLGEIVGPVESIVHMPLATIGFSQAQHERLTVHLKDGSQVKLVLKRFRLADSWTAYRTGDTVGREAALLTEPALGSVWQVFRNPYRALAIEGGEIGLLMTDLTDTLVPDEGSAITEIQQELFLRSLAGLHARFWESDALYLPWLAPLSARFHILHPTSSTGELNRANAAPVFTLVQRGWGIALQKLPDRIATLLQRPAQQTAGDFSHLPKTLLHGDTKLANFGFCDRGGVAAFDWATMGKGPATVDLGYCLAINSARLPSDKEQVIARYRRLLERELHRQIPPGAWDDMVTLAIVAGAGMLLWSKALALDAGTPGAAADWAWWVAQLEWRIG